MCAFKAVAIALTMAAAIPAALAAQFSFGTGSAELDLTLGDMNVEAKADLGAFTAEINISFGVPEAKVTTLITTEKMEPAEVYLAFQIAAEVNKPVEVVIISYKANKKKGWGAIAKELGIKPGSSEFQALKDHSKEKLAKVKDNRKKGKDKKK